MAISKRLRYEVLRRDGHRCQYCGAGPTEATLVVDHVVPEALGGKTEPSNLITACEPCNCGKTSTTPDAALVVQVDEATTRWASAIAAAAADMLAAREEANEAYAWFLEAWQGWTYESTGQPVPLPAEWAGKVDTFLSLGLPQALLVEAIQTTMTRRGVDNEWNYFCGVAWRMVRELQERAAAIANGDFVPRQRRKSTVELLCEILDRCDPPLTHWEYDRIIVEFRDATEAK